MDHELTKQIGQWLNTPESERDLKEGALLVLRLSNNRIMYQNFERNLKRSAKMIAYQLQKYYNFRVRDLSKHEVAEMQKQVDEIVIKDNLKAIPAKEEKPAGEDTTSSQVEEIRKGKRPDHDSLPEEIQALYKVNLSILQKMRNLHTKLELLSTEHSTCPDSERYPFLVEIIKLDKQYHENWNTYDHYVAGTPVAPAAPAEPEEETPKEEVKEEAKEDKSKEEKPKKAPAKKTTKTTKKTAKK